MADQRIYEMLTDEIAKIPVIDTHEHLPWDETNWASDGRARPGRVLNALSQQRFALRRPKRSDYQLVIDPKLDIKKRWGIVEPFWDMCRYTGYGRSLDISVKAIYGIDAIRADTIEELNSQFLRNKKTGHYRHVLRDLCNIETSLVDVWTFRLDTANELFKAIWQPLNFICPSPPDGSSMLSYIERQHSIRIRGLDDWLQALEAEMDSLLQKYGVRVLKCAIAYQRSLYFEKTGYLTAKAQFSEILEKWNNSPDEAENAPAFPVELQDYMMHFVLKLASDRNLTMQFHTGLLEGNGNTLANSNPELMTNLFLEYPGVDFDLFHISYPYQRSACALAKMFPDVFIDMCWAHIISPSACVSALDDFLDAVPYNKISAFGGDYVFPDGVYGHLHLSRQNISRALTGKIQRGVFDEAKALEIAKALYHDNPKRIFKL